MTRDILLILTIVFFACCLAGTVIRALRPRDPWRDSWSAEQAGYEAEVLGPPRRRLRTAAMSLARWSAAICSHVRGIAIGPQRRAASSALSAAQRVGAARRRLAAPPRPVLALTAGASVVTESELDRRVRQTLERAERVFEDTDTFMQAIR